MKNKKNPAEFLGAKILSTIEDKVILGGKMNHQQRQYQGYTCGGQQQVQQGNSGCGQQNPQEIQNAF